MQIKEALKGIKSQLAIPVIYNSSGYENKETIASLKGYVDVFLPDYKYKSKFLSRKLSNAPDYPQMAQESIEEMIKITGPCCFSSDGMIEKGTIIRHLVLPGFLENTFSVLSDIENSFKDKGVLISLMSQYTPDFYEGEIESLKHSLTSAEYNKAVNYACDLGLGGFMQELSSSDKKFTPSFNLEGVE